MPKSKKPNSGAQPDFEGLVSLIEQQLQRLDNLQTAASIKDEASWMKAQLALKAPKAVLNIRIDKDVLDYFRKHGRGYQTLINAVLRSYVEQKKGQTHSAKKSR